MTANIFVYKQVQKAICGLFFVFLISCAKNTTEPGFLGLLLLGNLQSSEFWANSNFTYRQKIVFGTSHDLLTTDYTSMFNMDTQISNGFVALANADDIRVYYQQSNGTSTELDRIIWNANTANSQIDFKMSAALPANLNEPISDSYYVYYGDANAGSAPATESNVYYFADFFERTDGTTINGGWTEWNTGVADPQIVSSRLSIPGNNLDLDAGVVQNFTALNQNFVLEWDWYLAGNPEANWAYFVNIGDSATMVNTDYFNGVGPGLYFGEGGGLPSTFLPNNSYNMDYHIILAGQIENGFITNATPLTSFPFRIVVDINANTYSYSRSGSVINAAVPFVNNGTTLNQIRLGTGDYINTATAMGYDNVRIFLKAVDDPEVGLQNRETN